MKIFSIKKYKVDIKYGFGTLKLNPEDSIKFNINPTINELYVWFNIDDSNWYFTRFNSLIIFKNKIDSTYNQEQLLEFLTNQI